MTINILNLSDIIDVDIKKSIQAFSELAKQSGVTRYDCCGMFSTVLGAGALIKAALFSYRSTIDAYKLGKMTTDDFVANCLNQVFKCPANENQEDWNAKLINAWNAMIDVNINKIKEFNTFVEQNPDDTFILITNSNDLHINNVNTQLEKKQLSKFEVMSPKNLANDISQVKLISSHTAGTFKTNNMIQKIIGNYKNDQIRVYTKYQGDLDYCAGLENVRCVKMEDGFDYSTFQNNQQKLKIH